MRDLVFLVLGFALALGVVAASEQVPSAAPSNLDCCARLGALKAGVVDAMNASVRGRHTDAQDAAMRALRMSGFRCSWESYEEPDAGPANRLVCNGV